jgi:hypothetical protein
VVLALALPLVALVLAGCRVDVAVDLTMAQNGSGTLTLTVTADRQVVESTPGLAADLRLDDLTDAGWTTDGPVGTDDGGLSLELRHTFQTPEQATALLASLNGTDGPFKALLFTRSASSSKIEYRIAGTARVDGLTGFADQDLVRAVGGEPYADVLDARNLTPDEAIGLTFRATLPGRVDETTSTSKSNPLTWTIPLDETLVDFGTRTTASLESGRGWSVLATLAFVGLGLWVLISLVAIVLIARRQHQRRKRRRSLAKLMALEARDDF